MINHTDIRIPKEYEKYIYSIEIGYGYDDEEFKDGKAYELTLKECCLIDDYGLLEYSSKSELLKDLKHIKVVSYKDYVYRTGKSDAESKAEYIKDYEEVTGKKFIK